MLQKTEEAFETLDISVYILKTIFKALPQELGSQESWQQAVGKLCLSFGFLLRFLTRNVQHPLQRPREGGHKETNIHWAYSWICPGLT